mgnify:CR=1 FL=1
MPVCADLLMLRVVLTLLFVWVVEGTVPGMSGFGKLEIWEGSAHENVWSEVDQYVDFRSYALSKLSDFGYLDHLLDDLSGTLRIIAGFGAATSIKCLLRTQGTLRRRLTYLTRTTPAAVTPADGDTPVAAPSPEIVTDENPDADDMTEMKAKAYNLVLRLTRPGSFQRMLQTFAGMRNGNILNGIIEADNRFVPDCEEDKEDAEDVYNAWRWDVSKTFFANVSNFEGAVFNMKQAGCKELPDGRKIYNRTKREILKLLPEFRSSFDFVENAGRGADGDGNIGGSSPSWKGRIIIIIRPFQDGLLPVHPTPLPRPGCAYR